MPIFLSEIENQFNYTFTILGKVFYVLIKNLHPV